MKIFKNRSILTLLLLLTFMSFSVAAYTQDKPNFIFILTDDQSYGMLGATGNLIVQTPNLDQLAEKGVLFTNAHVTSAICTPSRASILTSQFERQHGINFNSGTSLSEKGWNNAYPVLMRENGYYTGWIGKNHVPIGKGGYKSGLMEKSFDYWYAGHGHLSFYPKERHEIFKDASSETQVEIINEGIQDFLSNEEKLVGAQTFIRQRPDNKPFMLSVSFNLPHGASTSTMQLRESDDDIYRNLYRDIDILLPNNYIAKADIQNPKLPKHLLRALDRQAGYDWVNTPDSYRERYIRQLQAMTGIDRLVGELLSTLKKQKLDKNTIIIFTSDHGLFSGQFGLGGKALCYEVVTHVPLIIYDPKAKKTNRNRTSDALVQTIDIAPTLLSEAGIQIPISYQGKDLSKLLTKEEQEVREYVFTENLWSTSFGNPRCEAVQNKEWKYIRYYKNENASALQQIATAKALNIKITNMLYGIHDKQIATYRQFIEAPLEVELAVYEELYHLKKDPREITNLVHNSEHKEILTKFRSVWKQEIKKARGTNPLEVLRYTTDSEAERGIVIEPK